MLEHLSLAPGESTRERLDFTDAQLSRVSAGMFAFDRDFRFTYWGRTIEHLTGYGADAVLGGFAFDLFPFLKANGEDVNFAAAIRGESRKSLRRSFAIPSKGIKGFYNAFYGPLKSRSGQFEGGFAVMANITESTQAEVRIAETEGRFKNMADHSPVLLWMSGTDGLCNFFNQTWLDFTGRSLEEEWGVGWAEAVHHEDFQRCVDTYMDHFNRRKPFEMEYRLRRFDGEYRWILDRGAPRYGPDRSFAGFIGSCVDITDYKRIEGQLSEAKRAAEAANVAKTNFLATMSHEIRTPLGIVLGFSELLAAEPGTPSDRQNWISSIQRNGSLLSSIINSILDLSKIESGKIDFENAETNLRDLVDEISLIMEFQASEKGIRYTFTADDDTPVWIVTDALRLKQILINVIGNAVKFTSQGGVDVRMNARLDSRSRRRLVFEIADTGPGLTEEMSRRIFEPFTQADSSTTRRFGGAGLGLTLARDLARALGGDVRIVRSIPDQGSVFAVEIAVEVTGDAGASATENRNSVNQIAESRVAENRHDELDVAVERSLSGLKILVVDDSRDNQILVGRFLKGAGAEVETADNGAVGVEKAIQNHFDAVLMDIQMPVKDGLAAFEDLKRAGFASPIIALTAFALKQERERMLERGFAEHLAKPVDRTRLVKVISELARH